MLPLPTSIQPCPVVEALLEIRFTANIPDEAVFGVLYPDLSGEFPKVESLPVLQLPPQIRDVNPELRFQATHRLRAEKYVVSLGPKVFGVAILNPYPGWTEFRRKLVSTTQVLIQKALIKQAHRFGLRYISVFDGDVTRRLTVETKLGNTRVEGRETFFRTLLERDSSEVLLQVAKDQTVKRPPDFSKNGTMIDIDVSRASSDRPTLHDIETFIDAAHLTAKTLFYELLNPDFLKELKPVY